MRRVEISAKTIDEAIKLAAEQLETDIDNLEIEVLELSLIHISQDELKPLLIHGY